jgi:hypothetical protein
MSPAAPPTELHGYARLSEPRLSFDPSDGTQWSVNPLLGLLRHGPYSARFLGPDDTIRVAILATENDLAPVKQQLNELVHAHKAKERDKYLPDWPGFREVFRTKIGPAEASAQIGLPADLDRRLAESDRAHILLAKSLGDGLRKLSTLRDRFDVVVFYLPKRYRHLFEVREEGFDLHDAVKAVGAQLGLTTQIVTDDALTYRCRASVAWRLSTALYAKAGGIPWKLDTARSPMDPDTAYIGISYTLRNGGDGKTTFVTCCSQVFDSDGGGMEFVAYDAGNGVDLRNPYLSRDDMRLVMARSLVLYQDRHGGRSPRRLVIHKRNPFSGEEAHGCMDAWGATSSIECLSITRASWRAVTLMAPKAGEQRARPGYAVQRGTALQLDDTSTLVWIAGNAPGATLTGGDNYFQGGKGTPRPLLITRHVGAGPLEEVAGQALALSKMDWNNDQLYDSEPCTLRYADVLAKTIKHIPDLASVPYDYRLFM